MNEKKWSDKYLVCLLKQLPIIEDKRPAYIIFQNVQSAIAKKQQRKRIIPMLAAAAAFYILLILSPNFIKNVQISSDISKEGYTAEVKENSHKLKADKPMLETNIITKLKKDQAVLIYGIPDQQGQNVIPISLIIKKQDRPYVNLLYKYKEKLQPNKRGLGKYFLTDFKIKESQQTLKGNEENVSKGRYVLIEVQNKNDLNQGGIYRSIFNLSVSETFRWAGYREARYFSGKKKGILFEQMDNPENGILLSKEAKKGYLLFQKDKAAPGFLVPSPFISKDFKSALMDMERSKEEFHLQSSIPKNMKIEKTISNEKSKHTTVFFKEGTEIKDTPKNRLMLESIMMTAKEFGYQTISFEGIKGLGRIGNINLYKKNHVPLAPNPIFEDSVD